MLPYPHRSAFRPPGRSCCDREGASCGGSNVRSVPHFYINAVVQSADPRIAAALVFSVIRQTSVPWGISVADQPNLSTTRWRIVADHKDRRYHVESVISPSVFWVDLDTLDFSEGAEVLKLDLGLDMERVLSGDVSAAFEPAAPFAFQLAD